jgi:protein-S-isoprenylcysteine O-methyltransferase Ste14
MRAWGWTILVLYAFWFLYGLIFVAQYRRVQREGKESRESRARDLRDGRSMVGLVLEGVSFAIIWSFWRSQPPSLAESLAAFVLAGGSVLLGGLALRELGLHWRIHAVVTENHELIHTGPYSVVRHPIYSSLLGMLLATGLLVTSLPALAAAIAVYIVGTEIRIYAEEGLLRRRFGAEFEAYRARVKAYIPYIR